MPFSDNPVAQAHARAHLRTTATSDGPMGRLLLWTVVIPTIVFLVSNPLGWIILFLLCLGSAAALGFGAIL
jgi:hypothetical protein